MNLRRAPSYGSSLYPSPSARKQDRIGVTPFLRCVQCGLPNDTRKTAWSATGEGFGATVNITVAAAPGQTKGTVNTKDHPVQGGCRFCGSMKWRDSKVTPLPDDRNKPSSEWHRKIGR